MPMGDTTLKSHWVPVAKADEMADERVRAVTAAFSTAGRRWLK